MILALVWGAFAQIKVAIDVLRGMAEGDLSAEMPERNRLLASDSDEVGRCQRLLINIERNCSKRKNKAPIGRGAESNVTTLCSKKWKSLLVNWRAVPDLMIQDIEHMREQVDTGDDTTKERASIELMSVAFSRMSDEVSSLINARTEELVRTRDEIDSSIRYAARLQNALFPNNILAISRSKCIGGHVIWWAETSTLFTACQIGHISQLSTVRGMVCPGPSSQSSRDPYSSGR